MRFVVAQVLNGCYVKTTPCSFMITHLLLALTSIKVSPTLFQVHVVLADPPTQLANDMVTSLELYSVISITIISPGTVGASKVIANGDEEPVIDTCLTEGCIAPAAPIDCLLLLDSGINNLKSLYHCCQVLVKRFPSFVNCSSTGAGGRVRLLIGLSFF